MKPTRAWTNIALFSAIAIDSIGTGLFAPLSLLYFVYVSHLPLTTVGTLTSLGVLISLPVPLIAGHIADRFGARPTVIVGQLLQSLGFVGYLLAREPISIFVAIAVVAIGQRVFWSTFFTMVANLGESSGRESDRRFASVGMVQAGGIGLGALIAGLAIAADSEIAYVSIAVANAISFALSGLLLLLVPVRRPTKTVDKAAVDKGGYRRLFRDHTYLLLVLANVPLAICSVLLGIALPIFVVDGLAAPEWVIGPLLALNTVILALGQLAATKRVARLSRTRALAWAGALWVGWAVFMGATIALPWPIVGVALVGCVLVYAVAELIHAPISNALAAAAAPETSRGSYLAVFQYGFAVATLVVPAGFTWLFAANPLLPWAAAAVLSSISVVLFLILGRRLPSDVNTPAEH